LVEVRRRLRHGPDFLDRIYRIYRMKKSGKCGGFLVAGSLV
jgi:hypothetical protein